jgi:hypothetical protein
VPLARGLSASAREGVPLSAKFEIDDGVFQLSVYTMSGDDFSEVIVDYATGAVAKVTRITSAADLSAAEAQRDAMIKATFWLVAAVVEAERANSGYRAVSVTPRVVDAHPLAEVTLVYVTRRGSSICRTKPASTMARYSWSASASAASYSSSVR